ncbi:MAG: 2,4-dihydroxyhept-2-ene-1,7-dioic acid aldolase [Deltaproteobacteria bacterium]|nr:2,4-dihydroxyhept-2-ene-1,7-dioic acid aldolase [Deltaproteobacteria bacterium]
MGFDMRSALKSKQPLIGTIVSLPCPQIAEILSCSGFDWLFIDGEHAPLGPLEIQSILQAVHERCPCVVRIPSNEEVYIKQVLDCGTSGVIAPRVNSAETAEQVVRFAKYPPQGERSVGISRAHGYGMHFEDYMERANDETAVIVQIEHIEGVDNIDSILDTEGVDAVFIGPYDLSASLGKTGNLSDPEVLRCIHHVRDRCLEHQKPVGIFTMDAGAVSSLVGEGYTLIAMGMDTMMLGASAKRMLDKARS